jgi:hypothetical protein
LLSQRLSETPPFLLENSHLLPRLAKLRHQITDDRGLSRERGDEIGEAEGAVTDALGLS